MTTPFAQDMEHASWDRDAIAALRPHPRLVGLRVRGVQRLVQRQDQPGAPLLAQPRPRGHPLLRPTRVAPLDADPVTQEAYSHEVISFGFWAGDDTVGDAAYYSYTAPEPAGTPRPAAARRRVDRVRLRLARGPPLRSRPHRARPQNDAARVLPERLRGRRPPRRLGHHQLRHRHGAPPPTSSNSSTPPPPPTSAAHRKLLVNPAPAEAPHPSRPNTSPHSYGSACTRSSLSYTRGHPTSVSPSAAPPRRTPEAPCPPARSSSRSGRHADV